MRIHTNDANLYVFIVLFLGVKIEGFSFILLTNSILSSYMEKRQDIVVLKLGGSILTLKKSGRPVIRKELVKRIAQEVSRSIRSFPHLRLVLLHGAGSFGHPLAQQYGLLDKGLTRQKVRGAGETILSMRILANRLSQIFLDAEVPVVPIQSGTLARKEGEGLVFHQLSVVEDILFSGGVPLVGGDVMFPGDRRVSVVSADRLAVFLSKHFVGSRLLFATDVGGVYETFPPTRGSHPIFSLSRADFENLLSTFSDQARAQDVTGGMEGKLRCLLDLSGRTTFVFNGKLPRIVSRALAGEHVGTRIYL